MKVILLQDVAKVGQRYELKSVADGFGRNFLIARKLAVVADKNNLAKLEQWKSQRRTEEKIQQELLDKELARLADLNLVIKAKASPEGHLFAGLHQEDIVKALAAENFHLPAKFIELEQPIKTIGEHQIKVKTGSSSAKSTVGQFKLKVEPLGSPR